MGLVASLRQLRFPREFRIGPADWPSVPSLEPFAAYQPDRPALEHAKATATAMPSEGVSEPTAKLATETPPESTAPPAPSEGREPGPETDPGQVRLLADVGTGLWRLRRRLVDPETDRPTEETRRAYRHLESVWDALGEAGVEVRDYTGEMFPEGGVYAVKAVAFQPTKGVVRETVIETVKPAVYYRGTKVQMGEVIVGTPEEPEGGDEKPAPSVGG